MSNAAGRVAAPIGSPMQPYPDPIGFISWDHERQLEVCGGLEKLVSASPVEPAAEWAVSLLSFLTDQLPLHIQDEELDLFPILISRQAPTSNLGEILEQLLTEHEVDQGLADLVVDDLKAVAKGDTPDQPQRFQMNVRAYCEMQRRHLNWENRVVLPLAETLLTDADKQDLARRMAARRTVSKPR